MGITTRRETERWSIDLTGMTMFWLHATAFTAAFALAYGIIAACLLFAAVGIAFLCGVETTNPDDEVSDR